VNKPIILVEELEKEQSAQFEKLNNDIIWGWKRDVGKQKRLVYFSGNMRLSGRTVYLDRLFLYYRSVITSANIAGVTDSLSKASEVFNEISLDAKVIRKETSESNSIEFYAGSPTRNDLDRSRRLKLRRPRLYIPSPSFPQESLPAQAAQLFPADLYVGSGLSYEAGLPTLCDMHEIFGVDSHNNDGFTVGEDDPLPLALAEEGLSRIKKFCSVHTKTLLAEPTEAMRKISALQRCGKVRNIFTDNVDNLLSKAEAQFERVRGSGVFNERYEAEFGSDTLIVVGVAADRRQIIRQARKNGLKIVVVNPCKKVSPNVTHLEYLRDTDVFFKCEAQTFFRHVSLAETGTNILAR
jgi:NAD-dependent SIR2 family protein deacetylase